MEISVEAFLKYMLLCSVWSILCHCGNTQVSCPSGCSSCDDNGEWRCEHNNLVRIPSPLPENITSLVLYGQNIPTIYKEDFGGVRHLLKMQITYCNVAYIENGAFENLTDLIEFDMFANRLTTLDVYLFRGLNSLRLLDLSFNDIEVIENGTFIALHVLEQLSLKQNDIKSISVDTFSGLHNLDSLYLDNNNIECIENRTFVYLNGLERLNLQGNNLKSVGVYTFRGLHSLKDLYLGTNSIENFENGTFIDLNTLENLYLDRNNLKCLSGGIFRGLLNLDYLYLRENDIDSIEDGTFEPLSSLTTLDMGENKLIYINASSLEGPLQISTFYLNGNDLTSFEIPPSFSASLQTLHLSKNTRLSLNPCSLGNFSKLESLHLDNTAVNFTLDLFIGDYCNDNQNISPLINLGIHYTKTNVIFVDLMSRFPNLFYLSVGGGDTYVETGTLEVLKKLYFLWIYDENLSPSFYQQIIVNPLPNLRRIMMRDLKLLPTHFFDRISNVLYYIEIAYNHFKELPSEAFGNISSISKIFITTSNSPMSIDKDAFKGVPNLIELILQGLQLSCLPSGVFDHTPQLQTVSLSGSRLSCDCNMEWIVKYLQTHSLSVSGSCYTPPELAGVSLHSLTSEDFNCTDVTTTQLAGSATDRTTVLSTIPPISKTDRVTETPTTELHDVPTYIMSSTLHSLTELTTPDSTTKHHTEASATDIDDVSTERTSSCSTQASLVIVILLGVFGVIIIILVVFLVVVVYKLQHSKRETHRGGDHTLNPNDVEENGNYNKAYYETVVDQHTDVNDALSPPGNNITLQTVSPPPTKNHPYTVDREHYENILNGTSPAYK